MALNYKVYEDYWIVSLKIRTCFSSFIVVLRKGGIFEFLKLVILLLNNSTTDYPNLISYINIGKLF